MPAYDCSVSCCEPLKLGFGAIGGFDGVDEGGFGLTEVCCESGLGWLTAFDSWRGFGGAGGLEDDGDGDVEEFVSPDALLKPRGFLGGAGADLVLVVEATDIRCACCSAAVSVFTRRNCAR